MIPQETKERFRRIASMNAWDIADEYGCSYSGDRSPIPHGGFFYDTRDWEEYGYASIVEFWLDSESGSIVVECGTVNRPDDMESDFQCLGIGPDDPERNNIHAQIAACRYGSGIEPSEDFNGRYVKSFKLDDWKEWRIWRSVDGWIRQLGQNAN